MMTLDEYQGRAIKEAFYEKDDITYNALGITGEAGEIADHVKKMLRDDGGELTEERREILKKELGDVMWYVANMARRLDFKLSEIAQANIDKIIDRKSRGVQHGSGDNR
jgi:NTP pyrophosphatase (non-canonical NTP hydrolase)